MIEVQESDLQKVRDALSAACRFHTQRDHSNAALHLAASTRHSPLTSELLAAYERVSELLGYHVIGGATAEQGP